MTDKQCSKCKQFKPATEEYFYRQTSAKDGWNPYCRECQRNYHRDYNHIPSVKVKNKKYYTKRREKILEERRQYELEHADEIAEQKRLHEIEQKEKGRAASRRYHHAHKEEISARHKIYSKEHSKELTAKAVKWNKEHPEETRKHQRDYWKRKRQQRILEPAQDEL